MSTLNSLKKGLKSSVGQKYLMALSGVGLLVFIILHLVGNSLLYLPVGDVFNQYAHQLESMGAVLEVAEVGLLFVFVLHIVVAIRMSWKNRKARPVPYAATHSRITNTKGGFSKSSWASSNMIITGLVLFVFLVIHIWQFKYGPGIKEGYENIADGESVRDLHRLVSEAFHKPFIVVLYCAVMALLGFHLRHGFWSWFQSLGLAFPRWTKPIHVLGLIVAIIVAAGFFFIPIWIYFDLAQKIPLGFWELT